MKREVWGVVVGAGCPGEGGAVVWQLGAAGSHIQGATEQSAVWEACKGRHYTCDLRVAVLRHRRAERIEGSTEHNNHLKHEANTDI
jgi:hypothetical protein